MDAYFKKFPYIYYSNTLCIDICRRIKINENQDVQGDLNVFYPFEIIHNLRPDQISEMYYKDAEQDWLIYLANRVIDPYYGWYLDQRQFESLIRTKYGTPEIASRTILYYRNNWYGDQQKLDVSFYNDVLEDDWKKYYEPIWGVSNQIIGYQRKKDDTLQQTNRIHSYTSTITGTFANNEPLDFSYFVGGASVGQAQYVQSNSTTLIVQHVSGNVSANSSNTMVVTGFITGAQASINSTSVLYETISNNEMNFWSAVTAYDHENEVNEYKKNINMVGQGFQMIISQDITKKLRTNTNRTTNITTE